MQREHAAEKTPPSGQSLADDIHAISDVTKLEYARIAERLYKKLEVREEDYWWGPSPVEMVRDLAECRGLCKSTRITYSVALRWSFEQKIQQPGYAEALDELAKFRQALSAEKVVKVPVSKQTTRRKVISEQDLQDLLDELTGMHAKGSLWAGIARRWFASSVDVGMRPGEWEFARWNDADQTELLVVTGKRKEGVPGLLRDAPSPEQYIKEQETRVVPVPKTSRERVSLHLKTISELVHSGRYDIGQVRKMVTVYLHRACDKIWDGKKRYCLTTARGQFQANSKVTLGAERTAKLMGHSSASNGKTASYYASRRHAYSSLRGQINRENQSDSQRTGPNANPSNSARPNQPSS